MLLRWAPIEKEWDVYGEEVTSEFSRKNIQLIVGIHGLSEDDSYNFLADLERAINQDLEGTYGEAGKGKRSVTQDVKRLLWIAAVHPLHHKGRLAL